VRVSNGKCTTPEVSPLNAGIEAANAEATISQLPGDVHLPQQLRIQLLGYFLDVGDARGVHVEGNVIFHISVRKAQGVSATCRVCRQFIFPENLRSLCVFVEFHDRYAAVAVNGAGPTDVVISVYQAVIAVVKENYRINPGGSRFQEMWIVLTVIKL